MGGGAALSTGLYDWGDGVRDGGCAQAEGAGTSGYWCGCLCGSARDGRGGTDDVSVDGGGGAQTTEGPEGQGERGRGHREGVEPSGAGGR